jgi:Protein of unknown function (DUF2868)
MTISPPPVWKLEDIVDLEVLVAGEIGGPTASGSLAGRSRREVFRTWLEERRRVDFPDGVSPGREAVSFVRLVAAVLFTLGLGVGHAAVWSFFHGAANPGVTPEPINVPIFFVVCVLLPLVVTFVGFGAAAGLRWLRLPLFLRGAVASALVGVVRRGLRRADLARPVEQRLNLDSAIGAVRQRLASRKGALSTAVLVAMQLLGLGYAVGLSGSIALDRQFRSSVFGWQTTEAGMTPDRVFAAVRTIAMPWSGFVQPASPTLEQVGGTRFVKYADPAALPPDAAFAWSNFLLWSAVVYVLAPRLLLTLIGSLRWRLALRREDFGDLRFEALGRALCGGGGFRSYGSGAPGDADGSPPAAASVAMEAGNCLLLWPAELASSGRLECLREWLVSRMGWRATEVVEEGTSMTRCPVGCDRVFLVRESFMPATAEVLGNVRALRREVGPAATILVGLLGKPDEDPLGALPRGEDVEVWTKKLRALGDPRLGVLAIRDPR